MIGIWMGAAMLPSVKVRQEVVIHSGLVIRSNADRFFGIDINYIRDEDANRPGARPLTAALRDMGVRWLRFPGGEKSNYHLWSSPPYSKPAPRSLGWYATVAGKRMDFDAYIQRARSIGAEPYVVVGYAPQTKSGRSKSQWIEDARAWVKYANVAKKYGVRYWEIGNENWNEQKGSAEELAEIVKEFSAAMKEVDPSIRVGASGNNDAWWSRFLPKAAPYLDFLSVSQYTGWAWNAYEPFLGQPDLIETAAGAERAIDKFAPPADRARLRVIVAETNTMDYSKPGWPNGNDLGHALVTFATLGRLAEEPRVSAAMVWTTRWMNDGEGSTTSFYCLGAKNELLPTGRAIALWGQFALPVLLETGVQDIYASRSVDGRRVTIWIENRGRSVKSVRLQIDGSARFSIAHRHQFTGKSDTDRSPTFSLLGDEKLEQNQISETVAPLSVTVLSLSR